MPGSGQTKRVLGDMSFIDKKGNIVRPNKEDYQAAIKRRDEYNARRSASSGKLVERKRHYYSTRAYETGEGSNRYHPYHNLTQELSGIMNLVGIIVGIFFLSSNFTGNVIGNLTNSTSNILGAGLLVVGLIGGFSWLRSRKIPRNA